jgi:hypothetical protein
MISALKLSGLGLAAAIASTALMTSTASAQGPAFNCRYAKLPVEVAICDSSYLSSLDRRMSRTYYRSIFSAAMNACGISTLPNWRIFFLPSFCLSSSLRLRVASPP